MAKASLSGSKVGVVQSFAGVTPPTGYLLCDGSLVSRTAYARLFAIIGTAHGSGDNVSTFRLPDYRGRFLRGVDGAAGNDPDTAGRTAANAGGNTGNAVGSVQDDAFQGHYHTFNGSVNSADAGATPANYLQASSTTTNASSFDVQYVLSPLNGAHGDIKVSTESRPKNANVNYIISY